jgi:ribonuclease-3 family protein
MEKNLRNYAYLGDAVWELHVRGQTVELTSNARELHKITTGRVRAGFQADLLGQLEPVLTGEEREIARRARNLPVPVGRRNNQAEYRQATAFEALIGWWYSHDKERLEEILQQSTLQKKFSEYN